MIAMIITNYTREKLKAKRNYIIEASNQLPMKVSRTMKDKA